MKNFKKVLALVLVMATLLSFATVAGAENKTSEVYGDAGDIKYVEAVDVLTAIGVIDGISGDFKPGATLTRAQAAKIIAVFNNGDTEINKLYASANPFTDVEKGHWAESYIAYCYKMGIVGGVGDNKFDPNAEVTGIQFLKMALCVLGYDAEVEGLGGTNWDVNTLALAKDADLLEVLGRKYDYSAAITREAAVQIMFNALLADCVEYGFVGKRITFDQAENEFDKDYLTVAGALPMAIEPNLDSRVNNSEEYSDGVLQLFEDWELTLIDRNKVDVYGRPAREWRFDGQRIGEVYSEVADFVYNASVLGCDFYDATDLLGTYDAIVVDHNGIEYIENGVTVVDSRTDGNRLNYTDKTVDGKKVRQGNSVRMEVFIDPNGDRDEDDSIIYFIHTYLGEVDDANAPKFDAKGHEIAPAKVKVDAWIGDRNVTWSGAEYNFKSDWAEAEGFEEGDKVLVTYGEDESGKVVIASVAASKDAVISYDRKTKDGALIMGGKGVALSKNFYLGRYMYVYPEDYVTEDIKVYYDQYNRPIGFEPYDDAIDSSYGVLSALWVDYIRGDAVLKADFVYADGTEMTEIDISEVIMNGTYDYEDIYASEVDGIEVNDANEFSNYQGNNYYNLLYRIDEDVNDTYILTAVGHTAESVDPEDRQIETHDRRVELNTLATEDWDADVEYYKFDEDTCFIVEEAAAPRGEYNVFKGTDELVACEADIRAYSFEYDENAEDETQHADIVILTNVIERGARSVAWYNGGEMTFVEKEIDDLGDDHYIYEVEMAVLSEDGTTFEVDTYQFDNGEDKLNVSNNLLADLEANGFITLDGDGEIDELVHAGLFNCFVDEDGFISVDVYDAEVLGTLAITAADEDGEFFEIFLGGESYEVELDEVELWASVDGELVENEYDLYEGYDVSFVLNKRGEITLAVVELDRVVIVCENDDGELEECDDVEFAHDDVFAGRTVDHEDFTIAGERAGDDFTMDGATVTCDDGVLTITGTLTNTVVVDHN